MRRPLAPAVASRQPLQPPQPLALAPLAGLENAGSLGRVLLARLRRRTELPGGTAAALVGGRCRALLVHAPSSPDPIPTRLVLFPPQVCGENKVMVELGERMLLVAILGTVYPSTPSCPSTPSTPSCPSCPTPRVGNVGCLSP